jgi:hypothetical protein
LKKIFVVAFAALLLVGCNWKESSDDIQRVQQERILKEATAQSGMPAIKNFRERKILKDIIEMRDQEGLTTFTYIVAEMTGKLIFIGESVGYGIPAATQYTNPQKVTFARDIKAQYGDVVLPQADPNGLFSPASAEGTCVLLKDPNSKAVKPVYIEPRIIVSPFRLPVN